MNIKSIADLDAILIAAEDSTGGDLDSEPYYDDDEFEDESPVKATIPAVKHPGPYGSSLTRFSMEPVPYVDSGDEIEPEEQKKENEQVATTANAIAQVDSEPVVAATAISSHANVIATESKQDLLEPRAILNAEVLPGARDRNVLSPAIPITQAKSVRSGMFSRVKIPSSSASSPPITSTTILESDTDKNIDIERIVRRVLSEMNLKGESSSEPMQIDKTLPRKAIPVPNIVLRERIKHDREGDYHAPYIKGSPRSDDVFSQNEDIEDFVPFYDPDYAQAETISRDLLEKYAGKKITATNLISHNDAPENNILSEPQVMNKPWPIRYNIFLFRKANA
jgi:hypothetical protein